MECVTQIRSILWKWIMSLSRLIYTFVFILYEYSLISDGVRHFINGKINILKFMLLFDTEICQFLTK